jgi:hypothetical protein
MRWIQLLAEPLAFAGLVTLAHRLLGRWGALMMAAGWMTARIAHILATIPGPEVPLHDFERDPVPELLAVLAGSLAATAFAVIYKGNRPLPARGMMTAGVYLLVYLLAGIPAFLVAMS